MSTSGGASYPPSLEASARQAARPSFDPPFTAGGLVAFVILPLDLPIRLAVLGTDLVAAVVVGVVLARRQSPK